MIYQRILYQSFIWRGLYFVSTFLLNILFARYYEASVSGWVFYITNFYALIILITSLSVESGMSFFVSREEIPTEKLINVSIIWSLVVGLMIVIYFFLFFDDEQGKISNQLFLVSSISYISGILLSNFCSGLFYGKKNFITPNVICIACNMFLMIFIFISFTYPSIIFNSHSCLFVYFAIFMIQGLLLAIAVKTYYSASKKLLFPSMRELKKLMKYSLTAFTANVIYFLVYRVDYWFVKAYCSPVDLGNYVQVSKIGQVLVTIPAILASAVFALTAGGQKEEVNDGLKVLSRVLLITSGLSCLLLALTGKWLFVFIFGGSFNRMYIPFLLLIPGILSLSALAPLTAYYGGKNMISVNIKGSLISLLFIIIADLVFIRLFGIEAAALVSSLGYIIYYAYVLMFFRNEYKTSISGFFKIERSDFTWMRNFVFNTLK